jgi:hypothetical protein
MDPGDTCKRRRTGNRVTGRVNKPTRDMVGGRREFFQSSLRHLGELRVETRLRVLRSLSTLRPPAEPAETAGTE